MTITRSDWRNLLVEEALDPDLPIVDAHHHIWDDAPLPGIEPYGIEDYFTDKTGSGHNIVATVPVDCRRHYRLDGPERLRVVGETEYMDRVASEALKRGGKYAGACAAIVATADLMEGERVGDILDAHLSASERVRGVRFMTAFDESLPLPPGGRLPRMMATEAFRDGLVEVAKRGMTFDAWVYQTQLEEVHDVARAVPEVRIVLDHLGGPFVKGRYAGRAAKSFSDWKAALRRVASCPNVVLKIGGLNMPNAGVDASECASPRSSQETATIQREYILTGIDLFGPDRCMFVSNFPVDMRNISYSVLWNAFKSATNGFSDGERRKMFAGVAVDTYRIDGAIG